MTEISPQSVREQVTPTVRLAFSQGFIEDARSAQIIDVQPDIAVMRNIVDTIATDDYPSDVPAVLFLRSVSSNRLGGNTDTAWPILLADNRDTGQMHQQFCFDGPEALVNDKVRPISMAEYAASFGKTAMLGQVDLNIKNIEDTAYIVERYARAVFAACRRVQPNQHHSQSSGYIRLHPSIFARQLKKTSKDVPPLRFITQDTE